MRLELTAEEARFLCTALKLHRDSVEDELVHTEATGLQHALARDLEHVEQIEARLVALIAHEGAGEQAHGGG
jgi:hypothetical protein